MKKLLPFTLAPILSAFMVWCLGSFVAMDANPAHWVAEGRVMIAMLWSCGTALSAVAIAAVTGDFD